MAEIWYPGAKRIPGPPNRVSGPQRPKHGVVIHSMVGTARPTDPGQQNSWQFGIFQDGTVEQYYAVTAWCWHSGDRDDPGSDISNNEDLFGIEEEGGPVGDESEPWTGPQLRSTARLVVWGIREDHIRDLELLSGLWEHNWIPEASTACPSNRNPWGLLGPMVTRLLQGLEEEEDEVDTRIMVKKEGFPGILITNFVSSHQVMTMENVRLLTYIGVDGPQEIPEELFDELWITRTQSQQ